MSVGATHGRVAVGHPVDVASGEFFATRVDHELAGVVALSMGRRFSTHFLRPATLQSIATRARFEPLGPGWRPSWWAELRGTLGGGFAYTRSDGTELAVPPLGADGRVVASDHGLELQRVDAGHVRVVGLGRDRAEIALLFEQIAPDTYRLCAFEKTAAARIDVLYDTAGRPQRLVQRREQRGYELGYDDDGRIAEVHRFLPDRSRTLVVSYGYDSAGRLATVSDARGVACTYQYDDAGRIVRDETRGGKTYAARYDAQGRCVYASGSDRYEERSLRFDDEARVTWVTNSHGHTTTYEWNERGQVLKTTTPCGDVTRNTFDDFGRPASETLPTGEHRVSTYDELGRLTQLTSSFGWEQRRSYDREHRLTVAEEWRGPVRARSIRFGYDAEHDVIAVQEDELPPWRYEWTRYGELTGAVDPAGARRTWKHDDLGSVVGATTADGAVWQWSYDAAGRITAETDPVGHVRRIEYLDEAERSLRVVEPDGRVYERWTSPDERLVRVVLPGGASRTTELNSCGWPVRIVDEVGAVTELGWGTEPGELLDIVDANRAVYTFDYDADQRVVRRVTFDGRVLGTEWDKGRVVATVDGAGQRTELAYDGAGRVAEQLRVDGSTMLEYDARGYLVGLIAPEATLRFERDETGRIVAEDQDGVRLSRELDVMGRPVAYHSDYGVEARFGWSAGGRCLSALQGDGSVQFTRDAFGREVGRELGGAGRFEQHYDPVGRLVSQAYRGVSGDSVRREYAYDARGFLLEIQDSLRGRTELRHNDRGDLTAVLRERGWSDVAAFDGCQNRVYYAMTEHGAALREAFLASDRGRAQGYDAVPVDRMMARLPHVGVAQGYERGNRVVSLDRTDGVRVELEYDANGCVVRKTRRVGVTEDTWRYAWDSRQRMTAMTAPNGVVWRYRYDATARRIEKLSPAGESWRYVWRGQDMADVLHRASADAEPVLVESYLHEPGGTCPLFRQDATGVHYILPDQNDSPSEEVSATGGAVGWVARKGTWAEGWRHHGHAGGEPFLGQWFDAESGLHYNRFRYYDPDTGRYLSPDPIELTHTLNVYANSNSPEAVLDRYGLANCEPPWIDVDSLPDEERQELLNSLNFIDARMVPTDARAFRWGVIFQNRARLGQPDTDLPGPSYQSNPTSSPYREYRVTPAPGTTNAGPRRIVVNTATGNTYYTWTHYGDSGDPAFVRIR